MLSIKDSILNDTPEEIIKQAILAAMMTNRIDQDFKMSVRAKEQLVDAIERLKEERKVDELYSTVLTYVIAYNNGWKDAEHPNKKLIPYSEFSE